MVDYTTNEEDQREAAKLQARLRKCDDDEADDGTDDTPRLSGRGDEDSLYSRRIPNVSIDGGAHKYVLISALIPGAEERQHFVVSRRGAHYHRNVAEPFVEDLERRGYKSIDILGGGRIALDTEKRTISVYGYSYGFGLADHALSKAVIMKDPRFQDYEVTWSNDGY
jgi:phosphohistidine phosphatase